MHRELQRHKGVTLRLLWLEYRTVQANGYQYSRFCDRYREWGGHLDVVMRQVYRAGEKAFVDYAGPKFPVVDRSTGEVRDAMVFVGVLAASNYTFVDVTWSRALPEVRLSATTVEIFHKHRRVAAHVRIRRKGGYATEPAHMPAAHRAHAEWTPSRLIAWGRKAGPHTAAFVERLLESRPHPEQGYRSCPGLMKLLRAYSAERLEAACRRALDIGTLSYGSVKSILATGLDQASDDEQHTLSLPAEHAHIRGPEYYTNSSNGKES